MKLTLPNVPVLFFKPSTSLADPSEIIPITETAQNEEMDYEVELAVIIGKQAKNVSEEDAYDYILGYTCANDLTARKHQNQSSQWGFSKGPFQMICISLQGGLNNL